MTPEMLARYFHHTYERLAPSFGYETRDDTKQFDPTSKNGRLMVAVAGEALEGPLAMPRPARCCGRTARPHLPPRVFRGGR